MRHKSRIIDGKRRIVIVEDGKIVNRDPSKEELKGLDGDVSKKQLYADNEYLLGCLRQFYNEKRVPMAKDFNNNSKYPTMVHIKTILEVGIMQDYGIIVSLLELQLSTKTTGN